MRKGIAQFASRFAGVPSAGRKRSPHRVFLASPPSGSRADLAAMLKRAGFAPIIVSTGAQAATALSGPDRPPIVILDWSLDRPDTAALCRLLREDSSSDNYVYVLVILPPDEARSLPDALKMGADGVMTEPVNAAELSGHLAAGVRVLDMAGRLRASRHQTEAALTRLQAIQTGAEADLIRARRLQQALMGPRQMRFGDIEVSLMLQSAGHVGGDLVGLLPINAQRIAFYAIDVCGSGVTAALMTARLAAHLSLSGSENLALRIDENDLCDARPPGEIAELFNHKILDEIGHNMFFTMVYGDLDLQAGTGRLVQAGHPHPLLQAPDGSVTVLGDGGLPVGAFQSARWDEVGFALQPGGRLFIGSDGITEAAAPGGMLLGEAGLIALLRDNAGLGGRSLLEALSSSIAGFTEGNHADDISAVLVERHPLPAAPVAEPTG